MSDSPRAEDLVSGRECGECTACCVHLRIDTAELQKRADVACVNLVPAKGCAIHEARPQICRDWFCGWRMFDYLPEDMRPDKSGIIVRVEGGGFVLNAIRSPQDYMSDAALNLIGLAVANDVAIAVSTPGRPGHMPCRHRLNAYLATAVKARDKAAVKATVARIIEEGGRLPTEPEPPFVHSRQAD